MAYKTISIIVTDEASDAGVLNAAVAFAQREEAHLDVYCLGIEPVRYDAAPLGAAPILALSDAGEAQAQAEALTKWAEGEVKGAFCPVVVEPVTAASLGLEPAIARVLRYSDLIIAAQPYGEGSTPLQATIVEAALFGTSAPVLVIPPRGIDYSRAFERPLVAWNESDESLATVRKSISALQAAQRTEIVLVDPPSHSPERSDPGGSVCIMLARHGIKSEVSILAKTMPRVAEVINRHAQENSSDLIVMGAYGHSRFKQAIFGGATRDMLETAQIPVMMAH